MTTKRPSKPSDMGWVSPYLTVRNVDAALAFYERAFGFEKKLVMPGPDGNSAHAEVVWQNNVIMFGAEGGPNKCEAPATSGIKSPVSLYVYCEDVDVLYKRAIVAGAKGETSPTDMFWGDRMCSLIDPEGYIWNFATNVGEFDPSKAPK